MDAQRPKKEVAEGCARGGIRAQKRPERCGLIASQDFFERANEALAEKS
jgi:hypothetical protein